MGEGTSASTDSSEPGPSVTLLVVSQVRLYREGLVDILQAQEGIQVLAAAPDVDTALPLVLEHRPDVVLVELLNPNRLNMIRWVIEMSASARVIGLGLPHEELEVVSCIEAGMVAYVPPEASIGELVAELHRAMRGEAACTPIVAGAAFRRLALHARGRRPPGAETLTLRESEVLLLMEAGMSNKEIGRRLSIELATVKNHVHSILRKLKLQRRTQTFALFARPLSTGD